MLNAGTSSASLQPNTLGQHIPTTKVVIEKNFKRPQVLQSYIVDKETVDEIIFGTMNIRNGLRLELLAGEGDGGSV